jgi:hypothetical protein
MEFEDLANYQSYNIMDLSRKELVMQMNEIAEWVV